MIFTVNSFPRSGTNFLKKALAIASNQDTTEYMDLMKTDHEVDLFYDKEKKVITILRDPKEAIVSTIARGYYYRQQEYDSLVVMNSVVNWWFSINKAIVKNIDTLYPIMFEDFSNDLEKTLKNISKWFNFDLDTEDIFNKTNSGLVFGQHHEMQVSSRNSEFYRSAYSDYNALDIDITNKIYEYYEIVKESILHRQAVLGWE